MQKSTLLCSAVFSIFLAFFSCKTASNAIDEHAVKADLPSNFFVVDELYQYHAEINAYDRIITGIILIKKTADREYKLVFANESGFQLMALEFKDGKMQSHEVFKKLDKKIILNTLEKGIGMLFYESLCENVYLIQSEEHGFRCVDGKLNYRYRAMDDGKMLRVEALKESKLEKWIEFQEYKDNWPQKIRIQHEDIHLSYSLKALENE